MLAAGCPDLAPFMADELLLSMGDTEGIDYTMKEYMKLVAKTQACCDRLNEEGWWSKILSFPFHSPFSCQFSLLHFFPFTLPFSLPFFLS